ncbi:MAG: GNAT family N-acetyltransferase [Nitrospiraceae bacterium]
MAPSIHQATILDLDQLVPLFDGYRQFYGTSSDLALARQFLADRMTRNESVVLLARGDDGATLGFAQLLPSFSSVRAAPIYLLNDLFVVPAARRRGVGTLLMQSAADMARAAGAIRLKLSTAITNVAAQRLYEAMQWTREEDFHVYNISL